MQTKIITNLQDWYSTICLDTPTSTVLAIVGTTKSASNLNYVIIGLVVVVVVLLIITLGGNKK